MIGKVALANFIDIAVYIVVTLETSASSSVRSIPLLITIRTSRVETDNSYKSTETREAAIPLREKNSRPSRQGIPTAPT